METPNQTPETQEQDVFRTLGKPVWEAFGGERVDTYLADQFPFFSRKGWQNKIRSKELKINGQSVKVSYRLKVGDVVTLFHPQQREPEVDEGIAPIWRKGSIMAVFKPASLPMHENGPYRKNTFYELVRKRIGPEWAAIHRLDRETSGIVLCANSAEVRNRLALNLEHHKMTKEYLAICNGQPRQASFLEDGPLGDLKNSAIRIKKWVVPDGLPSATWFETVATKSGHSLMRCFPKTGRTNQIRIHLAFNDMPIVGDKLYHPDEAVFLDYFDNGPSEALSAKAGFHRLCLHAASLRFTHPDDQQTYTVTCPLPDELQALWDSLPP